MALIIQNPEGKILVLQEYETKPHLGKYRGMLSIPMETSRPKEPDLNTITRLLGEEVPGFDLQPEEILQSRIGIYQIVPRVWVTLYWTKTMRQHLPNQKSSEVGNYQWVDPREVLDFWLRQGAREMISDFLEGEKEVFCRHCRAPEQITSPSF